MDNKKMIGEHENGCIWQYFKTVWLNDLGEGT